MIRTRISLSEEEYEAAKSEARRLGISLAELLLRLLRTMLSADPTRPWMRFAGMIESGDPRWRRNSRTARPFTTMSMSSPMKPSGSTSSSESGTITVSACPHFE